MTRGYRCDPLRGEPSVPDTESDNHIPLVSEMRYTRGSMASTSRARALPKNYQLIWDVVRESGPGRHLTMGDVHAAATRKRPGIGFSTVYRGLGRLRDLGIVAEIVVPGADAATYEPLGEPHAHFRCVSCGTIEDVSFVLPQRTLKSLGERHAFDIVSSSVSFEGRCAACRTAAT
jgi:Fe2+ or Zn2+ uptake regulation protein